MKTIRVGAAAVNTTPLDWEGNCTAICTAIQVAGEADVGVLCLPELCVTGYGCEDTFHAPLILAGVDRSLHDISFCAHTHAPQMVFCVGIPVLFENALFNCVAVFQGSSLLGIVPKQHLAGDGLHYEPRWFRPWPAGLQRNAKVLGRPHPFGDLVFDIEGIRIGFEICEDAWVADRPGVRLARRGVDIILNPSASHFAFGKHAIRERFVTEGSRAFGVTYVYANLLGNEAGRSIYDGDALIATGGQLVARGPRFSYSDVELTTAVVDVEATRVQQARTASFTPSFDEDNVLRSGIDMLRTGDTVAAPVSPDVETPDFREREFASAVPLALFDYMRKSHTKGFVISLSGGADSAACATLVRLMVENGVRSIGAVNFLHKAALPQPDEAPEDVDDFIRGVMHRTLTCVYQASENSSLVTSEAAQTVAEGLGADYYRLNISGLIHEYTDVVADALKTSLTWDTADTALQNIQARARAPSIWMFANLRDALLITTSNRSEASVGYCTMDGDTAGSIAPIGGIDKPFIRRWLAHMSTAYPCLTPVVVQQPTAELRPSAANQTDEKDLMPYEVLDAAEKAAIRDKKSPVDVFRTLRGQFPGHAIGDLHIWVARYFRLWVRNQWKRERFAISFHVDDENLDPKTWCRFPILSGGYVHELRELDAYVEYVDEERTVTEADPS